MLRRSAQTGIRGGDLLVEQRRHQRAALGHQEREALFRSACGGTVFEILRGRSDHHIAVDRRADQNTLAARRRHGQHDARHHRPCQLVEHQQFAAPRRHREAVMTELGVEVIRTEAGRIDDPPAADVATRGLQRGVLITDDGAGHSRATLQMRTARHGVGGQGKVRGPGADDRLAGHRQPGQHPGTEVGHSSIHLVGGDDLAAVVEVAFGLVLQARQGRRVPRRSTRPTARRCARPEYRPAPRSRRAPRSRAPPAATRAFPGSRRNPCAAGPCWPCSCRRRRRRALRAESPTGSCPPMRARSRNPRFRHRRRRRR